MTKGIKGKNKFNVGDRVVYTATQAGNGWFDGLCGTVIYVDSSRCPYTVEFDQAIAGGITDERALENGIKPRQGHGWFCREENLTLAPGRPAGRRIPK